MTASHRLSVIVTDSSIIIGNGRTESLRNQTRCSYYSIFRNTVKRLAFARMDFS